MPCLRGIEISLFSNANGETFAEYPHPDGTSVSLALTSGARPSLGPRANSNLSPSPAATPQSTVHMPKTDPKVSVYIPSRSGTQFSVQYTVTKVPTAPCKFIFFKLYMNGRLMTAWGCDLKEKLTGTVGRTFWAPAGQWRNDIGIEGRQFMFMPGLETKSAADDGGLIEIRAFRAKDRRLRAPKLETFRGQEQYGIAAPSTGMIDKPEDVTYYQWHLIDPKNSPYAKFSFHYRTMESLLQLNLIPPAPRNCHTTGPWTPRINRQSPVTPESSEEGQKVQDPCFPFLVTTYQAISSDEAVSSTYHAVSSDETVTPNGSIRAEAVPPKQSPERKKPQRAVLRTPPRLRPFLVDDDMRDMPQPSKALRDKSAASYLRRPLPELPRSASAGQLRSPSASASTSQLRSPASAGSLAPSLSPSMEQSFEDRVFDNDDIEIGETQHVQIMKVTERPTRLEIDRTPQGSAADTSVSDYEMSLPLTDRCLSPPIGSPNYPATTGASLQAGFELFSIREVSGGTPSPTRPPPPIPTRHTPSPTRPPPPPPSDLDGSSPHKTYADTRTFAEWMGSTPSPNRRTHTPPSTAPDRWSYPTRRGGRAHFPGFQTPTIHEDRSENETANSSFDSVKENMPPELTHHMDGNGNWA